MNSNALEINSINATAAISTKVFAGLNGYAALVHEWNSLASLSGHHFLHFPAWYGAELEARKDPDSIYFVGLYDNKRLFAVLPFERLAIKKGVFGTFILQLFYPNEMGVNDVLSDRPLHPYRQQVLAALRRELPFFLFIRWQCVLSNGCAISMLGENESARISHQSKFIDFSSGFTAFWEGYSSKFRKGLLKKMRKAEEQGELKLLCATSPEDLVPAFEHFLEVEDSGWKGQLGTSIRKQPEKLAYYQRLFRLYGEQQRCQINILYSNDTPIAAQFGIRVGARLFLLKIGFREDFAAVSPGYLLLYKVVEHLAEEGQLNSISFVTGVNWIDRWHPSHIDAGVFYQGSGTWYSELAVTVAKKVIERRERQKAAETSAVNTDDSSDD